MRWFWLAAARRRDMWDDEAWHELTTRAVQTGSRGRRAQDPSLALMYRVALHLHAGEFDAASA